MSLLTLVNGIGDAKFDLTDTSSLEDTYLEGCTFEQHMAITNYVDYLSQATHSELEELFIEVINTRFPNDPLIIIGNKL